MLKQLTSAGISSSYPKYLQKRILLSNWISLILSASVAAPFVVISAAYFPPLIPIPVGGMIAILSCILFNYLGFINTSRIVVALVPLALAALYHAFLAKKGEAPIAGIHMIELSFSLVPFLIFDPRERSYTIVAGAFVLLTIMSFDYTNAWFEIDMNTEVIRTGFLGDLSVLISIISGLSYVSVLVIQNKLSEEKSEALLVEARASQHQATASEQAMKDNLQQLRAVQEEERKRQWANEGLTYVAELVRKQDNLAELADELLSYLVKYVRANQGGLFVVRRTENKEIIELLSTYAYDRKKFVNRQIEAGQGMIGQVYLEKRYAYLEKVPEDYIDITSGLGEAPPTALIIVPFQVNDEVEAILELASFETFASYQIDFLGKAGEIMAATVRNLRISERTRSLLIETQQQAEEMRATEEEMRQNMEELAATQEEMQRKEQEYLERIDETERLLSTYQQQ